jgi:hypothetical protein
MSTGVAASCLQPGPSLPRWTRGVLVAAATATAGANSDGDRRG